MSSHKKQLEIVAEFARIHDQFREMFPHLSGVLGSDDEFNGLVLKVKDDGTVLGVLKAFNAEGGPIVCFGSGYGAVGALHALDRTVQGGAWRVDKPWPGRKK